MSMLRDPMWQFIGVAIAVLALMTSVVLTLVTRRRKRLVYKVLTNTPVLTVREEIQGRVKVLLDDRPVRELSLLILRLTNGGNVPIRSDDYERPVSFLFGATAAVVSAEVTHQQPTNLNANLTITGNSVNVYPLLLNPRDSITIKCLATGEVELGCDARIVGVSAIREIGADDFSRRLRLAVIGAVMFLGGIYGALRLAAARPPKAPMNPVEIALGIVGIVGFLLVYIPSAYQMIRISSAAVDRAIRAVNRTHDPQQSSSATRPKPPSDAG